MKGAAWRWAALPLAVGMAGAAAALAPGRRGPDAAPGASPGGAFRVVDGPGPAPELPKAPELACLRAPKGPEEGGLGDLRGLAERRGVPRRGCLPPAGRALALGVARGRRAGRAPRLAGRPRGRGLGPVGRLAVRGLRRRPTRGRRLCCDGGPPSRRRLARHESALRRARSRRFGLARRRPLGHLGAGRGCGQCVAPRARRRLGPRRSTSIGTTLTSGDGRDRAPGAGPVTARSSWRTSRASTGPESIVRAGRSRRRR